MKLVGQTIKNGTIVLDSHGDLIEGCELDNVSFDTRVDVLFINNEIKFKENEQLKTSSGSFCLYAKVQNCKLINCTNIEGGYIHNVSCE